MIARMTGMLKEENILQSVKLGLWTLELDTVNGKNRLYVDKSMRSILGIDDIMNSEEYFRFWYDNISDGYYDYVQNALHDIITTEKIIEMGIYLESSGTWKSDSTLRWSAWSSGKWCLYIKRISSH